MSNQFEVKKIILPIAIMGILGITGCGGSSSSSDDDDGDGGGSTTAGQFTMNISGGRGGSDGGDGGDAEYIYAYKYGNGNVEILSTGSADASFSATSIGGNTGDNPLNVTTDTTVQALTSGGTRPAAGLPFFINTGDTVYISTGPGTIDSSSPEATGISISSGTTLTVELNDTSEGDIDVVNDIINNGTITTADQSTTNRGDLQLTVSSYWGSGNIDTSGTADGQFGGDIEIDAEYSVINHGDMTSSGAAGTAGDAGSGGRIDFYVNEVRIENTGDLNTSGGDAIAGAGGEAGDIIFNSDKASVRNSGDLTAMGGDGTTSGGNGGYADFDTDYTGSLLNAGNINTSGGDASAGNAGDADYVEFYTYSPKQLINSGNITARGGNTTDPASSAGYGDYFSIYLYGENLGQASDNLAGGVFLVSGNIDLRGGDAVATGTGNGGNGGYVYVQHNNSDQAWKERDISFLGYTDVMASGGDGNQAGNGGYIEMYNYETQAENDVEFSSGSVINEANLDATGGDVPAGATTTPFSAGYGGYLQLETADYSGEIYPDSLRASNSGDLMLSAGSGSNNLTNSSTTRSGYIYLWGYNGVSNSGTITANGGEDVADDGGTNGYGGYVQDIELYSDAGVASNTANITGNGGDGEYRGGYTGSLYMYGQEVSNTGNIVLNGGAADPALAGSQGGNATYVELFSPDGNRTVSNTGNITSVAGAGETAGDDPVIIIGDTCTGDC